MKKNYLIATLVAMIALVGSYSYAAYNDATLNSGVVISSNSVSLEITGSDAVVDTMIVYSGNFEFRLRPGSSFKIRSTDRKKISHNAASTYVTEDVCTSSESRVGFSMPSTHPGPFVDILVTPDPNTTCSGSAGSSGGGGGGGGGGPISGGGGVSPLTAPTATTTGAATTTATVTSTTQLQQPLYAPALPVEPSIVFNFTRDLTIGSTGEDVLALQRILNLSFDTQVALSGVGSPGQETIYFGSLTRTAAQKFQGKHSIPTTGYVGPLTRAKLNELYSGVPSQISSAPTATFVFTRWLDVGSRGEDVKALQQLLIKEGVYPQAIVSGYFGSLTKAAVEKFQVKYGIAQAGDPGYGYVGPKTRAKLNELSAQ